MTDQEEITVPVSEFRLLTELAGISRNPRYKPTEIAPFIGGSERAMAARRAHDRAKARLRNIDNDD